MFVWVVFMFEIVFWDFVGGKCFFLVVYGQWEEILVWMWFFGGYNCCQYFGFVICCYYGVIGLVGNFVCFEDEWMFVLVDFYMMNIKYYLFLVLFVQVVVFCNGGFLGRYVFGWFWMGWLLVDKLWVR